MRPDSSFFLTIGRTAVRLLLVLFLVSLGTFFLIDLVPGDPAINIAGPDATPEQLQAIRDELGLNAPIWLRYFEWIGSTLSGNLGKSLVPPVQNVSDMIAARLPVTLALTVIAILLGLVLGIAGALLAAATAGRAPDRAVSTLAYAFVSIPGFLMALLLIFFLVMNPEGTSWVVAGLLLALGLWLLQRTFRRAGEYPQGAGRTPFVARGLTLAAIVIVVAIMTLLWFPDFPRQGFTRPNDLPSTFKMLGQLFLPALTLALGEAAVFSRVLRGDLLSTLRENYILAARGKGMPTWRILVLDALRPSSFSLMTVAGVSFGRLIGGTVVVEQIFNLPGMGTMIIDAVLSSDYRVVQASVLVIATIYVLLNAVIDASYALLDPRIRRAHV